MTLLTSFARRSKQERFNRKSLQQVYDTGLYNAGRDTGSARARRLNIGRTHSLPRRMAAITRGLRRPCSTANHKRLFVRCVGDDVVAYGLEPQGFVVRSGLLCPWCGNSTSFRTASRMSSRTRRAARGLSSTINSQMSVMSCAAPG